MDTTIVAESLSERMIAAYLEGAESGMIEARGYGLSEAERADALEEATRLYSEPEPVEAAVA